MPAPAATHRRSLRRSLALLLSVLAWAGAAPGEPEDAETPPEPSATLRVGAATSLRNVLEDLRPILGESHPEVRLEVAFGASSALAAQLRAGAPLDLLLAADERIVLALAEEGLTEPPAAFAGNRLVVVVTPGLEAKIRHVRHLQRPEVRRIAVPEHAVPVGRYARSWLEEQGMLEALKDRLVVTEHARATLATVDQGNADAAIVYLSDARQAKSAKIAFQVPVLEQPRIAYAGAVTKDGANAALARSFLALLREPRVAALLIRDGFTLPPGPVP